ncbi:MAG: HAMP domain-containing histidine kinase [Muribaculaceae bacterium]|nr:HAMP domain-containing histidine kinase [Muribaculaceae bacterium]
MLNKLSVFIIFVLSGCAIAAAQPVKVDSSLYFELRQRLAEAPNSVDSMDIAINLFDLNFDDNASQYGEIAYRLAMEHGEMDKAMSMLRQLTTSYQNDIDKLTDLERRTSTLPNSSYKNELATFISLRKSYYQAYSIPAEERSEKMKILVKDYLSLKPTHDEYENIRRLFELCIYLHAIYEQSALLRKYYDKLDQMIERLPPDQTSLRNLYYSMAATSYSNQFMPQKAVEMDLRLLQYINANKKRYIANGRRYRTFDTNLYSIYCQILSNYDALTQEEIERYYAAINEIAARNVRIADDMQRTERPQIHYCMANRQYDKALPMLKRHINELANRKNAIYFNRAMMTAANATGDTEAYKTAAAMYIKLLEDYIRNRTAHNLAELTITYDLNEARSKSQKLLEMQKESEARTSMQLLYYTIAIAVLMLVLAVVFIYQWSRKRRNSLQLKAAIDNLKQERDTLQRVQNDLILARDQARDADRQKTDFIHMISHQVKTPLQAISEYTGLIVDCMDESKKKYLGRFAEVVKLNTELINSMINDITEVSALEADEIEVKIQPASLREICTMAIDSLRPTLNENQSIVLDTEGDHTIATDRRRLEQIVSNLLENAVKFSEKGVIHVAFNIDNDRNSVDISVSDHGPGIPPTKQDVIFERFVKLDSGTPGMGLGLYVTRLLVKLMGGEIHLDRSYRGGARFVVSLRAKVLQ